MRLSSIHERAEYKGLYVAYKEAWQRFSSNVSYWQSLESATPEDRVAVEQARNAARQTEASYRETRNRLAKARAAGLSGPEVEMEKLLDRMEGETE
jgi:hypothetical protein